MTGRCGSRRRWPRLAASGRCVTELDPLDCGILAVGVLYWAGSRDTLRRYYTRAAILLGTTESEVRHDERSLHSGIDPDHSGERDKGAKESQAAVSEANDPPDS